MVGAEFWSGFTIGGLGGTLLGAVLAYVGNRLIAGFNADRKDQQDQESRRQARYDQSYPGLRAEVDRAMDWALVQEGPCMPTMAGGSHPATQVPLIDTSARAHWSQSVQEKVDRLNDQLRSISSMAVMYLAAGPASVSDPNHITSRIANHLRMGVIAATGNYSELVNTMQAEMDPKWESRPIYRYRPPDAHGPPFPWHPKYGNSGTSEQPDYTPTF